MFSRASTTSGTALIGDARDAESAVNGFSSYTAPLWLPGGHLQTIYGYSLKQTANFSYRRERWATPDGDFIDLDWLDHVPDESNLVILFHGLEGSSRGHYAVSLMNELRRYRWRGVVPHFRGCSGETNRLERAYHSGDSSEVDWILRRFKENNPKCQICVVGVSIGGNMLLKWLGEQGEGALDVVNRAAAVSVPMDLPTAAQRLDYGWNRLIYTSQFLRPMKQKVLAKILLHRLQIDEHAVRASSTFRELDNLYTAPFHGFKDAEDYWAQASSKPWLKRIEVPTLLLNARNDPFFPGNALPTAAEVSDAVLLEYPDSGGHVGFVSGKFPGHLGWLTGRILNFFLAEAKQ